LKPTLDTASKKREAFYLDSLRAWETFCATGQYVTAEQADAWLAQLEQGHDVIPTKDAFPQTLVG
jgi:predicted transcriptional regulator